jgi:hypothetical protein
VRLRYGRLALSHFGLFYHEIRLKFRDRQWRDNGIVP